MTVHRPAPGWTDPLQERILEAWAELRESPGRAVLQTLGILLGVASVLGGFSITDSQRRQSEALYVKLGGLDKLNVNPRELAQMGLPSALQAANLGLRTEDGLKGAGLEPSTVSAMNVRTQAKVRLRSPHADLERTVTGISADFIPMEGFEIREGRNFSAAELELGSPVVILGSKAAAAFFPAGGAVGQTMTVGTTPATIIGIFQERIFKFSENDAHNIFARRNRIIVMPAAFVQRRLHGDSHQRVDRITFKLPDLGRMERFSRTLTTLLMANHRLQEDFRLDDVSKRGLKAHSQEKVYDLVFLLSGLLALLGGGIVNVNIQLASLKERVREVGVKMALGASGREIFLAFMTEALLLTILGGFAGLILGVAFSWFITATLGIPLHMRPSSFGWAFLLAALSGFLFALYPAWKAARLSPMEALRYE